MTIVNSTTIPGILQGIAGSVNAPLVTPNAHVQGFLAQYGNAVSLASVVSGGKEPFIPSSVGTGNDDIARFEQIGARASAEVRNANSHWLFKGARANAAARRYASTARQSCASEGSSVNDRAARAAMEGYLVSGLIFATTEGTLWSEDAWVSSAARIELENARSAVGGRSKVAEAVISELLSQTFIKATSLENAAPNRRYRSDAAKAWLRVSSDRASSSDAHTDALNRAAANAYLGHDFRSLSAALLASAECLLMSGRRSAIPDANGKKFAAAYAASQIPLDPGSWRIVKGGVNAVLPAIFDTVTTGLLADIGSATGYYERIAGSAGPVDGEDDEYFRIGRIAEEQIVFDEGTSLADSLARYFLMVPDEPWPLLAGLKWQDQVLFFEQLAEGMRGQARTIDVRAITRRPSSRENLFLTDGKFHVDREKTLFASALEVVSPRYAETSRSFQSR